MEDRKYEKLRSIRKLALAFAIWPVMAFGASPALHFSDLTWGPKTGWEGSASKGAAVTVWGENLGTSRGSSFITVNNKSLTSDSDYAEWGASGGARGLQRITFWLNSSVSDGAGNIRVTVNGAASNTLPFTVSPGTIYFISVSTGSNSNNGLYSTAQGGSNGPFRDIYKFNPQNNPSGDGQYIVYVRGGTYTAQDPAGDSTFVSFRGPYGNATKQKALIAFPAETPVLDCSGLSRAAFWPADYSPYGLNSYFTFSKLTFANGNDAIDNFGNNIRVVGNHMQNMLQPTWSGVVYSENSQNVWILGNFFDHNGSTTDGSYKHNIYSISTQLAVNQPSQYHYIGWNEFANAESGSDNRGGVVFARTDSSIASQFHTNHLYYNDNYFHGGNQNFVEIGDGPTQTDIWLYNNIFVGGPSVNSPVSIRWTTTNANLFNNTFYLPGSASVAMVEVVGNSPGSRLNSANNVFYGFAGQQFFDIASGSAMTSDHDLFYLASGSTALPGGSGLTLTNPITGDPLLVNPGGGDFHLKSGSRAIDAGTSSVNAIVTDDYAGTVRPQGGNYDLGAYEYLSGGSTPTPAVSISVSPSSATLAQGQSQQFTAAVSGSTNTAVTWTMSPSTGTLSTSGMYTAPATVTTQTTVQIKATSAADPTKSATATVTLTPPATSVSVSVSPASVSLGQSQSQQFTSTVSGSSNSTVTWTLNPLIGTLSASGYYTAPATITTQQTVRVTATSAADGSKSGSATVTLVPPVVSGPTPSPTGYSVSFQQVNSTQLSVSWTAPANHSQNDSIVLTGDSSVGWWSLSQQTTGSATSGTLTFNMPTSPGLWQFQYKDDAKNQIQAASQDLAVGTAQFTVSSAQTTVAANGTITVKWTAPTGRPQTWADTVGLYLVGSTLDQPATSQYTMGATSGTVTMTVPAKVGTYELRYVTDYVMTARSAPITVQ